MGVAGELLPKLLETSDLPARTVAVELDLDAVMTAAADVVVADPISTYPATSQDVALVVDASTVAGDVLATLRRAPSPADTIETTPAATSRASAGVLRRASRCT